MFLFVSLPKVKRAERRRGAKHSFGGLCQQLGAAVGLLGGLLVALSGALLTAISWLVSNGGVAVGLHQIGGALLCSTIPLLMLGAFYLDGVEAQATKQQH